MRQDAPTAQLEEVKFLGIHSEFNVQKTFPYNIRTKLHDLVRYLNGTSEESHSRA
jgi:hypothetical protein